MDRLWAILPNVWAWGFIYTAVTLNPANFKSTEKYSILKSDSSSQSRLFLMAGLILIWGIRLTYVFWRRGYFKWGHEDHRWDTIRKRLNYPEKKLYFHLYNFIFMAFVQNWILLGHALPFFFIINNTASGRLKEQQPLNELDLVVAGLFIFFFVFEVIADEQQWIFQTKKYDWLKNPNSGKYSAGEIVDFKRGFIVKGLYKYSRHPNYFGEMFLWWCIYLFTVSSQYTLLKERFEFSLLFNYSLTSSLVMTLLFPRSSLITEKISSSKYPEYKEYRNQVNQIIPSLWRTYSPKTKNN